MARVLTASADLQIVASTTEGAAFASSSTPTFETSTQYDGRAAWKMTSNAQYVRATTVVGTDTTGIGYYAKFFLKFDGLPASNTTFVQIASGASVNHSLRITSAGVLEWTSGNSGGTTLSAGTWYCIEVNYISKTGTASTVTDCRVNGVQGPIRTANSVQAVDNIKVGIHTAPGGSFTTLNVDDLIVNDNTGGTDNTWVGVARRLAYLAPTADLAIGSDWVKGAGGAISATGYQSVDNFPATGKATGSAADGDQLRNSTSSVTAPASNADFTLQTPTAAGLPSTARVEAITAAAWLGDNSGSAVSMGILLLSNPSGDTEATVSTAVSIAGALTSASLGSWLLLYGNRITSPSIALGTAVTMRVGKRTATTNHALIAFAGALVEWEDVQYLTPTGITSSAAFGSPTIAVAQVLAPTGITSTQAMGSPTVTVGATPVAPTGIASSAAFGTPVITTGAVTVTPTGITSSAAFGTPTLLVGVYIIPGGIASSGAFGTAVITTGAVTVTPTGVVSSQAIGSALVVPQPVTLAPTGISSSAAFGTPVVRVTAILLPTGIASAAAVGSPSVFILVDHPLDGVIDLYVGADGTLTAGPGQPETPGSASYTTTLHVVATSGTWTLTFNGQTTTALPFNPDETDIRNGLLALSTTNGVNVFPISTGTWTVVFLDVAADSTLTIDASALVAVDPVDIPGSVIPYATFDERWASGQHIGVNRPTFHVAIRRGRFNRSYKGWQGPAINARIANQDPRGPWQATWEPQETYVDIPGVTSAEVNQSFDQNGIATATVVIENIVYSAEAATGGGTYHKTHRGWMSPFRGYVAAGRTALTDEHGVTVAENDWFERLNRNAQVTIWHQYGPEQGVKSFTGLVDDVDTTSRPDTITLTLRDFGQALSDERIFGWNKDPDIIDPVHFVDQDQADQTALSNYDAESTGDYDSAHGAEEVLDSDSSTAWWSNAHTTAGNTEWVQVRVRDGRYEDITLSTDFPNHEIYVSVQPKDRAGVGPPLRDNVEITNNVWYDGSGGALVPGAEGGIPYVYHDADTGDAGARTISLGGAFKMGDNSIIRVHVRALHAYTPGPGLDPDYIAGIRRLAGIRRSMLEAAITQRWVRVDDITDVVRVILRWAGFKEWNIENAGIPLPKPIIANRGMSYMDVINLVGEAIGYEFSIAPPAYANASIGIPVFRRSRILSTSPGGGVDSEGRPDPRITVTDQLLLSAISVKLSDEELAYIIRVRGRESRNRGVPLGADRTRRVQGVYRPPWSGVVGTTNHRLNGGLLRHVIHNNYFLKSVDECLIGAYFIALKEAVASALATVQFPGHYDVRLDDHIVLMDLGTGLSTRLNVRERHITASKTDEHSEWTMTVSGAIVDTPYVQEIVAKINAAVA